MAPSRSPRTSPAADTPRAVRWLTPEQQRLWRAYLRGASLLVEALDRDLQRHGVSLSEYEILAMLSESAGGHLRMSALADLVLQSRSRITHTAARLERRGWVRRQPSPEDRRGVELWLMPAGRERLDELSPVHVESVRTHLIDRLTDEQIPVFADAMLAIRAGILGLDPDAPDTLR